jgi:hypothetical protein
MDPASRLLSTVLPALLARAPLTHEKVDFAWRTVVGATMSRATHVQLLDSGTLLVRVDDANWRREVQAAAPAILPRLEPWLGSGTVRKLVVAGE